jgi:hypothetical protein
VGKDGEKKRRKVGGGKEDRTGEERKGKLDMMGDENWSTGG